MDRDSVEILIYAFEAITGVKETIEETGKHKRIARRLDNACSELMIAIENISDKLK